MGYRAYFFVPAGAYRGPILAILWSFNSIKDPMRVTVDGRMNYVLRS